MGIRRRQSRLHLISVFPLLLGLVACTGSEERVAPEPRPALVAVANGAASHAAGFSGVVRSKERAVMAATVPGRVTQVHVDLGERVRRGQALLSLDTTAIDAAVRTAESAVLQAQAASVDATQRFERAQSAAASGAASPTEFNALKVAAAAASSQLEAAQSALTEARWHREESQLRAPIDGLVAARHVEPGQALGAGMPAIEIDGRGREIVIDLPASLSIKVGDLVDLQGPKGRDEGAVIRLNERLDAAAIRRAIIEAPADAQVGEVWSMHARVAEGLVYVPIRAIQRKANVESPFVFKIVDDAGSVVALPVRIGAPRGASIEVIEGLSNGDRIVIAGASSLREGDRVVPVDALR